ncbi:MAG: hypothetical protein JWQ38_2172 [Flavipsychrobacter sp.]|nr:hypothetical protein [Flavipsychrobacter sp.]
MKKWLFNPFIYVAGSRALLIGWVVMIVTAVIGYYSNTHFTSIGVKTGIAAPLAYCLIEQFVAWGCTVLLFYPAGRIFSTSAIRVVDVAGTMALARWPMIFCAVMGFAMPVYSPSQSVDELIKSITGTTIALSMLVLVFAIWMITLMVNAFMLSCNLKGSKAVISFIVSLLLAEILSSFILHHIHNYFI